MNNSKLTSESTDSVQRFLTLKKNGNTIDLGESYKMYPNQLTKLAFESEIHKVTFKTLKNSCNLFFSTNELICEDCVANLKINLDIEIDGDGSFFEVLNYTQDFKILFDTVYTTLIDTVKNGVAYFSAFFRQKL